MVYFGQAQNGLVKIGWTESVFARIQSISAHVRQRVQLLAAVPGTRQDEAELHRRFAAVRVHGTGPFVNEWYLPTVELLAHVATLPPAPVESLSARRPGAVTLQLEIEARGLSQNRVAKMLGVSTGVVCRWLSGARVPDIDSAARLEDLFGILMRDWARDSLTPLPDLGTDHPSRKNARRAPRGSAAQPRVSSSPLSPFPPHRGEMLRAEPQT